MRASRAAVAARRPGQDLTPTPLVFASYLAPINLAYYQFIAAAVGERLGIETRLRVGRSFTQLTTGEVDVAFLCGLPYIRLAESVEPLAAPLLAGERYRGEPTYFSDVIVRRESSFQSFTDLRGSAWSFNEPDSHSGYLATLVRLLELGETERFFGQVIDAGWHEVSIELVGSGQVDASAVDSQVLAVQLRKRPDLQNRFRVIDSFGPSPIQPIVAQRSLDPHLRQDLRRALLSLTGDGLTQAGVTRLAPVTDGWYDPIRSMLARVNRAGLSFSPSGPAVKRGNAG